METSFLNKLLAYYEEDPNDPFNLYALALEYQKSDNKEASRLFEMLIKDHPEYLPTYYQAAQFFINQGEQNRAEKAFETGIVLAISQKNSKAQTELTRARQAFEDERSE